MKGINAVNVDEKGRIWAGSWNQGLHVSSPDRKKIEKFSLIDHYALNTNYEVVLDVHIDANDQVWVATGYGGVVKLSPKRAISYVANQLNNKINLPDNNVQAVIKDSNGAIWCGTWSGEIGYSLDGLDYERIPGDNMVKFSLIFQFLLIWTAIFPPRVGSIDAQEFGGDKKSQTSLSYLQMIWDMPI